MEIIEGLIPVNIEDEMRSSYLDYAMSVIVGRALPDVRDGLKPVHRRILYAMSEQGNHFNKPYRKSARIAGDVIGKYHPHGESAVYDAIVRMAQDFSMRYPLIDGQGNFGSIDGDPPAAMRYTEVRMSQLASEILADLDKDTVDFQPNYDGSLIEPKLFPSRFPPLLVNGSSGIAVGMATNIPPHNLGEVMDGLAFLSDNPECSVSDLMKFIKGPDFPTGATIHGLNGIRSAYATGRGSILMRAKIDLEMPKERGPQRLVVNEIPYQVNKSRLLEKIAYLVREKKIEGITDLRDESDREGMRIVIECRKDAIAQIVINQLYKHTQLQESFGVIMLALVGNQPRVLNLKEVLVQFLQHRREIVTRRTLFDLKKTKDREHILEGLKMALDQLDQIIQSIRIAKDPVAAQTGLVEQFGLTSVQAKAILEMRLQRLTGLERQKILDELASVQEEIKKLEFIRDHEEEKTRLIKEELLENQKKFSDPRRTDIEESVDEPEIEDLIVEEDVVVTFSNSGYVKRNSLDLYRSQKRGGKGVKGIEMRENDFVSSLFVTSNLNRIFFFTNRGKVHQLKAYQIPEAGRAAKGKAIVNLLNLDKDEAITTILPITRSIQEGFLVMATRSGLIKKTPVQEFHSIHSGGKIALRLEPDDELISVWVTDGTKNILVATRNGMSIHFNETRVRSMGRTARGVRAILLAEDDRVVDIVVTGKGKNIVTVTENGFGKRTDAELYRLQGRSGRGIIDIKTSDRNGKVVGIQEVAEDDELMVITSAGTIIRVKVKEISSVGRNTQGVRIIEPRGEDKVVSVRRLVEREES